MKIIMYIINVPGVKCQTGEMSWRRSAGGKRWGRKSGSKISLNPPNHPYVRVPLVRFDPHRNLEADRAQEYT